MNPCRFPVLWFLAFALAVLSSRGAAQSNSIFGTDVSLGSLGSIVRLGGTGAYPNGINGLSMATTACNVGTVNVPWLQAMNENHPYIAFLVAREADGRLVQISDRSYVKHAFYALSNSQCTPCQQQSNGTFLGVGCSDTYSVLNNGDNFWLGPPDEVDPWLGAWTAIGSHFDQGEPNVGPPQNMDGQRSLTQAQASALEPVGHRVRVTDSDLSVTSATYYYQGHYVIRGEPEASRNNNLASRRFVPTHSGFAWNISVPSTGSGNTQVVGSVLNRWSGSTVTSSTNGNDDGRVLVAVKVTGPTAGRYHYEYAIHNRDNVRGVRAFVLPMCPGTQVQNVGFRDIDQDPLNQWAFSVSGSQMRWETQSYAINQNANALKWNSIFNFWFDSDAAPVAGTASLEAFRPGAGAASFGVSTTVPASLYNVSIGPGCGLALTPNLVAIGAPPRATLGNASFGLECSQLQPSSLCWFFVSATPANLPLGGGCTLYLGGVPGQSLIWFGTTANAAGVALLPTPVPNLPALEGANLFAQAAVVAIPGAIMGLNLSNGLRIRLGDNIGPCP